MTEIVCVVVFVAVIAAKGGMDFGGSAVNELVVK
jgi:hypothetical protein